MSEKSQAKILKEKLFAQNKNGYFKAESTDIEKAYNFANGYSKFFN